MVMIPRPYLGTEIESRPMDKARARAYWRTNLRYLAALLIVWFTVSFGGGILFADALDRYRLGGFKLGFWIGQQGAILVFVAIETFGNAVSKQKEAVIRRHA